MSIRDEIKAHWESGALVKHVPLQVRSVPTPELRELYILAVRIGYGDDIPAIHEQFTGQHDAEEEERWIEAEQYLDDFVTAERITIPHDSRRAKEAFMSRLDPPEEEVWDIRCYDPPPGLRMLGSFAEKDIFVALSWAYRETLGTDYEWGFAKRRSLSAWAVLFPDQKPLTGGYPYDYITGSTFSADRVRRPDSR